MGTTVEHEPALQLWTMLRDRAFASLKDDFTARVAECSLSLPQGKLIRELARPESQRELARRLHYDPAHITPPADSPQARRLVWRPAGAPGPRGSPPWLSAGSEGVRGGASGRGCAP